MFSSDADDEEVSIWLTEYRQIKSKNSVLSGECERLKVQIAIEKALQPELIDMTARAKVELVQETKQLESIEASLTDLVKQLQQVKNNKISAQLLLQQVQIFLSKESGSEPSESEAKSGQTITAVLKSLAQPVTKNTVSEPAPLQRILLPPLKTKEKPPKKYTSEVITTFLTSPEVEPSPAATVPEMQSCKSPTPHQISGSKSLRNFSNKLLNNSEITFTSSSSPQQIQIQSDSSGVSTRHSNSRGDKLLSPQLTDVQDSMKFPKTPTGQIHI